MAMMSRKKGGSSNGRGGSRSSGGASGSGSAGLGNKKRGRTKTLDLAVAYDDSKDEHIDSSDEDDNDNNVDHDGLLRRNINGKNIDENESSEEENLDVKKVRLAREYLAHVDATTARDNEDDEEEDDGEDDNEEKASKYYDAVSNRLQRDRLVRKGALKRDCADEVTESIRHMQEHCERLSLSAIKGSTRATTTTTTSDSAAWIQAGYVSLLKHHDLTPTCVSLTGDSRYAVSGSKDHSVVVWDVERQVVLSTLCPHWRTKQQQQQSSTVSSSSSSSSKGSYNNKQSSKQNARTNGQVLSVACSDDGHFVAVGKRDATVSIFDLRAATTSTTSAAANTAIALNAAATATKTTDTSRSFLRPVMPPLPSQQFTGHKSAVTALAFRSQSHQLFTASDDRCIRHYNLDEMLYMETLYGHQFGISDIDCYVNEQPVSVGRDRTARAWKLSADSHLIFRGGSKLPSADAVTVLNEDTFLTGHDNGVVSLWTTDKKRAVATVEQAHGCTSDAASTASTGEAAAATNTLAGRGVVSIACIKGSDVAATGSNDGYLRLWKARAGSARSRDDRGLDRMGEIPLTGFINDICFSNVNSIGQKLFCVAAIGQEHRLGRWERVSGAKNRIAIVQLQHETSDEKEAAEDKDNED